MASKKVGGLYADLKAEYELRVSIVYKLAKLYRKEAFGLGSEEKSAAFAALAEQWEHFAELVVAIEYDQKRFARDIAGGGSDAEASSALEDHRPGAAKEEREAAALKEKGDLDETETGRLEELAEEMSKHETVNARQDRQLEEAREALLEMNGENGMRCRLEVDQLIEDGIIPAGTLKE